MANVTIFEILNGAIRAGREVKGVSVTNCIDQKEYLVDSYKLDVKEGKITSVIFVEAYPEEGEDAKTLTITEKNPEVVKFRSNPNFKASIDRSDITYDAKTGTLTWKVPAGTFKTNSGNIQIVDIAGGAYGKIYFTQKLDGVLAVGYYDIQLDKFDKISSYDYDLETIPLNAEVNVYTAAEGRAYLTVQSIENKKIGVDDNKKAIKADVAEVNVLLQFEGDGCGANAIVLEDRDRNIPIISDIMSAGKDTVFIAENFAAGADGIVTPYKETLLIVDREIITMIKIGQDINEIEVIEGGRNGESVIVRSAVEYQMFYKGNMVMSTTDPKAIATLSPYTVYCGEETVYMPDGTRVPKYAYCSDNAEVIRFTVKTTDRGINIDFVG